jgi:hypothetical protein
MWDCCFFLWDPKICGIHKYLYKAKPRAAGGHLLQSHDSGELSLVQTLFIEIKAQARHKAQGTESIFRLIEVKAALSQYLL